MTIRADSTEIGHSAKDKSKWDAEGDVNDRLDELASRTTANEADHPTSTDNAIARYDGVTGALQDSGVTLSDESSDEITVAPPSETTTPGTTVNYKGGSLNAATGTAGSGWLFGGLGLGGADSGEGGIKSAGGTKIVWTDKDAALKIEQVDAKGDLLVGTAADTVDRLAVGTDGKVLVAASGEATGLKYDDAVLDSDYTAAGKILVGSGAGTHAAKGQLHAFHFNYHTTHSTTWLSLYADYPAFLGTAAERDFKVPWASTIVAITSDTDVNAWTSGDIIYYIYIDNVPGDPLIQWTPGVADGQSNDDLSLSIAMGAGSYIRCVRKLHNAVGITTDDLRVTCWVRIDAP